MKLIQESTLAFQLEAKSFGSQIQDGPKHGLFLRVDNLVTVSGKKACDMLNVSQFCLERCTKLGCQ